jgi:hypothetical protein
MSGSLNGSATATDAEIRAVIRQERNKGAGPIVIRETLRELNSSQWKIDDAELEQHVVEFLNETAAVAVVTEAVEAEEADAHWLDGAPMDPAAEVPEPLPSIPGFPYLHAGVGALLVGPTGTGRSSLMEAGAYDAAAAGLRVAYLGSEVTGAEFNARSADLASRRGDTIDDALRFTLSRVRYLDLASVVVRAFDYPDDWARDAVQYDVVIIDPLSAVASALDLDFDTSNAEFVRFYDTLVQPLVAAGVAVVMLENIGHALEARSRAKGASAKQDRADLTFSCKLTAQPVGLIIKAHKIRSVRAPFRRGDSWMFDRDTQHIAAHVAHEEGEQASTFRPTEIMERVSRAVQETPGLSRSALRKAVQGKTQYIGLAIDLLVAEGFIELRETGGERGHFTGRLFPPADEVAVPSCSPHSSAVPDSFPVPLDGPGSPVPPPFGGKGERASSDEDRIERLLADNSDLAGELA